jgi:hypothetical protein
MDPNANLREIRELVKSGNATNDAGNDIGAHDASRMVELVEALDEWITRGGFLPDRWEIGHKRADSQIP